MKRPLKIFLIICGALIILWVTGRITGAFQFYTSPTPANAPTIKTGDWFFASNLVKPERLDFICFYAEHPEFGRQITVYRLVGLPGDEIMIRNGNLFVNEENVDRTLTLSRFYRVSQNDYDKIKEFVTDDNPWPQEDGDTVIVCVADQVITSNKIKAVRYLAPLSSDFQEDEISKMYNHKWTVDSFGPVKVPENKYFAMGDNRQNAYDSRFRGFIDKSDVKATVLWK